MRQFAKKIKKTVATILICCFLTFSGAPQAHAGIWVLNEITNILGPNLARILGEILAQIKQAIIAKLKEMIIKKIIEKTQDLISDTTGHPAIIADYERFIFKSAQRHAIGFVDDFFAKVDAEVTAKTREELRKIEHAILGEIENSGPRVTIDQYIKTSGNESPYQKIFSAKAGGSPGAYGSMQLDGNHLQDIALEAIEGAEARALAKKEANIAKSQAGLGFDTIQKGGGGEAGGEARYVAGSVISKTLGELSTKSVDNIIQKQGFAGLLVAAGSYSVEQFIGRGIRAGEREFERGIEKGLDEIGGYTRTKSRVFGGYQGSREQLAEEERDRQ